MNRCRVRLFANSLLKHITVVGVLLSVFCTGFAIGVLLQDLVPALSGLGVVFIFVALETLREKGWLPRALCDIYVVKDDTLIQLRYFCIPRWVCLSSSRAYRGYRGDGRVYLAVSDEDDEIIIDGEFGWFDELAALLADRNLMRTGEKS